MLEIACALSGETARLSLAGDLALETVARLESVVASLPAAVRRVEVECGGLAFMDSTGVGALLGLSRRLQAAGGELIVADLRSEIQEIIEVLGLTQTLGAIER